MTQKQLAELPCVPRWLGLPMYPGGAPLRKDQISIGENTLEELYQKRCKDIYNRVPPSFDDEEYLKNYILYYIHAPIFYSEFTEELLEKDFSDINLDGLIMDCLEYGIDPL